MTAQPDVIVVGAGIVGLATAYFLSEAGMRVTVVEQEAIGHAASGFAAGMLLASIESDTPPALGAMAREGLKLHGDLAARFREESGVDVHYRPVDLLEPTFSDREAEDLHARRAAMPGWPRQWLSGAEARDVEPRLAGDVTGALLSPGEAQVDPYRITLALGQAAERHGAEIRHGRVTGLLHQGTRVTGVRLAGGTMITGGRVVLSGGPWTGPMASWLGTPVPVTPLRGQILRLRVPGDPLRCCLMRGGDYAVLKADGETIAGTTEEAVGFRPRPTRAGRRAIMRAVLRLVPSLAEAEVVRQTACLRPLSGDGLPLMGAVPGWEGLYLATGHGRKGILFGPVSGRAMAELLLTGRPTIALDAFTPDRFARTAVPVAGVL